MTNPLRHSVLLVMLSLTTTQVSADARPMRIAAEVAGRIDGPEAFERMKALNGEALLRRCYLLPAVRGRLWMELGASRCAAGCYQEALRRPCTEPERRFLERKERECGV